MSAPRAPRRRRWPTHGPWIMAQRWERLLFAHWPLAPARVAPLLPRGLTLETFEGRAWLGITPFIVSVLRPRGLPSLPGVVPFQELNVRTYVRVHDRPGVFFFSLDAGSALAVAGARAMYSLPYFWARGGATVDGTAVVYESRRRRAPHSHFAATYRPTGPVRLSAPGTLAYWLTERYALYAVTRRGAIWRGDIEHRPWPLQPAEAEIVANTMPRPLGLELPPGAPLLHCAERLDVHVWWPRRVIVPAGPEVGTTAAPPGRTTMPRSRRPGV